jgi:hypothetical protein
LRLVRDAEAKLDAAAMHGKAKPQQMKAAARLIVWQVESLLPQYSWYCGWGQDGRAAEADIRAHIGAIKARFALAD